MIARSVKYLVQTKAMKQMLHQTNASQRATNNPEKSPPRAVLTDHKKDVPVDATGNKPGLILAVFSLDGLLASFAVGGKVAIFASYTCK
jgi:hypothetical protein